MKSYQDQFIEAFSEALADGDKGLIEECIAFTYEIAERVWRERYDEQAAYPLERLQNNCRRLLFACADSGKDISKLLFVKLLDRLYDLLFEKIKAEKTLYMEGLSGFGSSSSFTNSADNKNNPPVHSLCVQQYFSILDSWNVYIFFNKILSTIDIRLLGEQTKISDLLYKMQVVDFALSIEREQIRAQYSQNIPARNEHEQDYTNRAVIDWKPDFSILHIQQYLGWYLNRQLHNPDITTEGIIDFARDCILSDYYLYRINAQYEVTATLARTFTIENAVYICGLITAGLIDVAKEVFLYCVGDTDNSDSRNSNNSRNYITGASYYHHYGRGSEFILPITVFCYLYYLGFWEEDKYVSTELRNQAKQLSKDISHIYRDLFTKQKVIQNLTDELRAENKNNPRYIYSIMRRFDFRAQKEGSYKIVTGEMVKDFCLFSITFNNPLLRNFDWMGDSEHNILSYLEYVKDEKTTCEKLARFVEFTNVFGNFTVREAREAREDRKARKDRKNREYDTENLTKTLFERLKLCITSQYKDTIKEEANKANEEYKKKSAEIEDALENLEQKIEQTVREKFKDCISVYNENRAESRAEDATYHTVEIVSRQVPTDDVISTLSDLSDQTSSIPNEAYVNLLQEYIDLLIKKQCLRPKIYNMNDRKYIDFLAENDFDMLLGARWFFMASDPEFSKEFNKAIDRYTQIIADGYVKGLRSALIKKRDIHFFIRNIKATISDVRPYDYRAWGDIELPFENEDERRVFIANERKVIIVQAEIRVEAGNASGVYFE